MSIKLFDNKIREKEFTLDITEWTDDWHMVDSRSPDDEVFERYKIKISENGKDYFANCQVAPVKKRLKSDSYVRDYVNLMSYCRFETDFLHPITVCVYPSFKFTRCEIEPYCTNKIGDGFVKITITKPTALVITFDGNRFENLLLSAEEYCEEPDTNDKNIIYFGKGVHDVGEIVVSDGQTLYLEGGAYIYGNIVCQGNDITVCGKGTLCGSKMNHDVNKPRKHLFAASHCRNLTIKNIMLLDSPTWTLSLYDCHGVVVDGIREICRNENSDGIDVCISSEVEIKNVFLRNWDDNISFKCRDHTGKNAFCKNALVKNCVLWADKAHNMIVGPEGTASAESVFDNIVFSDIKVLNSAELMFPQGCMCILCADNAVVKNVVFKNIEVYHIQSGRLVNILYTDWFANCLGKKIDNITFEHIRCYASEPMLSRVFGQSDNLRVTGVQFIDFSVNGKLQTEKDNTICKNGFAEISFS